jgi:hypothetical protein
MTQRQRIWLKYVGNAFMLLWLALGVSVVLYNSVAMGMAYVLIIALSFVTIAYSMCAKCPCRREGCAHIWLGRLAEMLPGREPGEYTSWDRAGFLLYLVGLHALPQYWLWRHKALFILFWALSLGVFTFLHFSVCTTCINRHCPLNRRARGHVAGH